MHEDQVGDDEVLFRCVRRAYVKVENGALRISSLAFTDPELEISVDRADLCSHDPKHTQRSQEDYVCTLMTHAVRAIEDVRRMGKDGKTVVQQHVVLVEPKPEKEDAEKGVKENPAHAVIRADPQIANDRVFRRLQDALTRLASWEKGIAPATPN